MARPVCVNTVLTKGNKDALPLNIIVDYERGDFINQVKPYSLEVELTSKCAGSCRYCYSSSTMEVEDFLPTERVMRLVDEAVDLGVKKIGWAGGDPQLHPDWFELISYATEKGLRNFMATSGLISKRDIQKMCELGDTLEAVGVHIDTINQEDYDIIHRDPKTLDRKMQGYRSLLEAGWPPEKVLTCITIIKPNINSIPETIDWFADEMGSKYIDLVVLKGEGFASQLWDWEPSLDEVKRIVEYRAKKLGEHWLRTGSMDAVMYYCRSAFTIQFDGSVSPCPCVRDLRKGNIFQESLTEIYERSASELLYNVEIKGPCGVCENKDVCFGCRATAYHYTGDVAASDPKCYLNPEAKQYASPHAGS